MKKTIKIIRTDKGDNLRHPISDTVGHYPSKAEAREKLLSLFSTLTKWGWVSTYTTSDTMGFNKYENGNEREKHFKIEEVEQ